MNYYTELAKFAKKKTIFVKVASWFQFLANYQCTIHLCYICSFNTKWTDSSIGMTEACRHELGHLMAQSVGPRPNMRIDCNPPIRAFG